MNKLATTAIGSILLIVGNAQADFVINDDLIVDGSACVGFDCTNGLAFGFSTIILKENNLRIFFDDTSTSSSFPRNDWQLTANDSANGGANKFSIDDISNSRTPFTVEANARSHSLYVDDGGRIGIRTSTPSTEIHVIDGDSPTLRLQQDGSSGFAPQTWDLAGNETNFFIRDVTNGSQLPFRIRPAAPTNSIFVDVDGDVGMGTSSPDSNLHISDSGTVISLVESSDGAVQVRMKSDVDNRRFLAVDGNDNNQSQIDFRLNEIRFLGETGTTPLAIMNLSGFTVNGVPTTVPDYVFEKSYELMPLDSLKAYIEANKRLPEIPSAETFGKTGINMTELQMLLLKKVEELTLYTLAQQETIDGLRMKVSTLEKKN